MESLLSGKLSMALLVLLAGTAGARVVAADLLAGAHERLRRPLGHGDIALLRRHDRRVAAARDFGMLVLDVPGHFGLIHRLEFFGAADRERSD